MTVWAVLLFGMLLYTANALTVIASFSSSCRSSNFAFQGRNSFVAGSSSQQLGRIDGILGGESEIVRNYYVSSNTCTSWTGPRSRQKPSFLLMRKGDGKKKRKKKSATPPPPAAAAAPAIREVKIEPMRVTNDINIPIKRQIRYAQMNKEFAKQRANPGFRQKKVVRTRYRRTWDEEEIEQKKEERKKRGQDPNWDVILNQTKASPLVVSHELNLRVSSYCFFISTSICI